MNRGNAMARMKLGSLFDGIGGWLLAAQHAGVCPTWSSEIAAFPAAVTAVRFPDVAQLGDITRLDGSKVEPVDIVCAGSPCQDLSVAGKRAGLDGERSGLFHTAIKFVRDMRRATGGCCPRYFVWENVPGAFSSNKGMDFRAVLEEISESEIPMPQGGKWAEAGMVEWDGGSLAWRLLDAQYWGVPQRRRRIFLVADFAGGSAGEILFKPEVMPRDSQQGKETGENVAAGVEASAGNTGGPLSFGQYFAVKRSGSGEYKESDVSSTLAARDYKGGTDLVKTDEPITIAHDFRCSQFTPGVSDPLTACDYKDPVKVFPSTSYGQYAEGLPMSTLRASGGDYGGGTESLVRDDPAGKAYCIAGNIINREDKNGGHHLGVDNDVSFTLNTVDRHAVAFVGQDGKPDGLRDKRELYDVRISSDGTRNWRAHAYETRISRALDCAAQSPDSNHGGVVVVDRDKTVRRLTVLECERLQGLPDNWTLIDHKTCSESARYKALGNGMAQPNADFVIQRIVEVNHNESWNGRESSERVG